MSEVPPIRAGDAVLHRPSGETWVVASVVAEDGAFYAAGWPETRAAIADVDLVRPATDVEHREMLERAAKSRDDGGISTSRGRAAARNLDALNAREARA